jgi:hypothetical protein
MVTDDFTVSFFERLMRAFFAAVLRVLLVEVKVIFTGAGFGNFVIVTVVAGEEADAYVASLALVAVTMQVPVLA